MSEFDITINPGCFSFKIESNFGPHLTFASSPATTLTTYLDGSKRTVKVGSAFRSDLITSKWSWPAIWPGANTFTITVSPGALGYNFLNLKSGWL